MTIIEWVLVWDPVIQTVGLGASIVGVGCSLWLTHEAWGDFRRVRYNGEVERLVARSPSERWNPAFSWLSGPRLSPG